MIAHLSSGLVSEYPGGLCDHNAHGVGPCLSLNAIGTHQSCMQADFDLRLPLVVACRGGLIKWADLGGGGAKHIASRLEGWAKQFEGAGLSGVFKPSAYLANAAANGTQLSAGVQSSKL